MTTKMLRSEGCSILEGFSYSLDVLYGGRNKQIAIVDKKIFIVFSCKFSQFLVLDPYADLRSGSAPGSALT
jgi:hypothetical protein